MAELSAWRIVLRDCLRESEPAQNGPPLASLATVRNRAPVDSNRDDASWPAVRTVNLRWLTAERAGSITMPDEDLFRFVTDTRSDKAEDLHSNPRAELLLWFPTSGIQIRIAGNLSLTRGDHELYAKLQDHERLWFSWPPPGKPRDPSLDAKNFPITPPSRDIVPDCFAVASLAADFADIFDGTSDPFSAPYKRTRHVRNEDHSWTTALVNP